jgi:hypothetical protein
LPFQAVKYGFYDFLGTMSGKYKKDIDGYIAKISRVVTFNFVKTQGG